MNSEYYDIFFIHFRNKILNNRPLYFIFLSGLSHFFASKQLKG